MGRSYHQLGLAERIAICRLRADGKSLRAIAAAMGRSAATISREVRRNSVATKAWRGGYDPARAQSLAERRRRWDCRFKLARQPDLQAVVRRHLAMGLSPEQIAGRLARDEARTIISHIISHQAIYRFIYHRSAQKDYWHRLLPRRKSRRGRFGKRGGSPASLMARRQPIAARPDIADRQVAGHWEADLMAFSAHGQSLLLVHERTSRLVILTRQIGKTAESLAESLIAQLAAIPPPLRRTVTFDNGTEFALHYQLTDQLAIDTYFCDVRSPWQKGGVENAIGRLRRHLPRRTILPGLSDDDIRHCAQRYNHTPRKCLGFQTPAEVFSKLQRVALQS
jgi:IS30 family transposase